MPRTPRRFLVDLGSTNHCTWRSHNFTHVLESDHAKRVFLQLVQKYAPRHGILVRSYCLMGTHPHLVVVASKGQTHFSSFWQVVNHLFARWYNRQEKFRRHVLTAMRYGDLNPVRAGMVRSAKDYPWSSYRHYAFGEPNALVTDEPEYLALGRTPAARRLAYRQLFAVSLTSSLRIRRFDLVEGHFYGDAEWVEQRLPRAIGPPPSG